MILTMLIGILIFFYFFGTPMYNVFIHNFEYKYDGMETFGSYCVTERDFISEEAEIKENENNNWGTSFTYSPTWARYTVKENS